MNTNTQSVNPPAKILIAEDSATQAQRLRHILERKGYEVSVASNGRLALEMALQVQPALIISDVNMPEMNGYELTRHIRENPELRPTPMILVTSMSDPEDVILGLQSGADNFVLKPYEEGYLLDCVQHAITNRDLQQPVDSQDQEGVTINFNGHAHHIMADRSQILHLLLSTYGAAIQRNKQLIASEDALRRRTSEALTANRFLDSVIESDPNMIFMKDAATLRFTRVNKACEELLGISRDQLIGKNDYDFFPEEQAGPFIARDREVLAGNVVHEVLEEPISTLQKGVRLLHTKKVALMDEDGAPSHLLGISEDVTEQRALERTVHELNTSLAEYVDRLKASNQDLESFTYSVAHDLRGPLSVIGGYAGMLEKHCSQQLDEKARRFLSVIRSSTNRMASLIDDLLVFFKSAGGVLKKAEVDMNGVVLKIIDDMLPDHPEAKKPEVELSTLPAALADVSLLSQVWINLISNAIKYSSKSPAPRVKISGRQNGSEIIYTVEDNGAGFDMEQYDKLFGMFQRFHSDDEFEGVGIGLAIVHRVVTRHGGRVWAEGRINEGATFSFALPA